MFREQYVLPRNKQIRSAKTGLDPKLPSNLLLSLRVWSSPDQSAVFGFLSAHQEQRSEFWRCQLLAPLPSIRSSVLPYRQMPEYHLQTSIFTWGHIARRWRVMLLGCCSGCSSSDALISSSSSTYIGMLLMSSVYSSAEQSLLPGGASGMSLSFVAIILI